MYLRLHIYIHECINICLKMNYSAGNYSYRKKECINTRYVISTITTFLEHKLPVN